jgi:hypothetical protein
MSTRCIVSQPTSIAVCPVERAGEQRATYCSRRGRADWAAGSELMRLETSPLISSLARGSLGGQASPRTQSARSNSGVSVVVLGTYTGSRALSLVGWPSLVPVLCAPFSAISSRLCPFSWCSGGGLPTAPAGRPFGILAVRSARVIRPELGHGSRGPWAG